MTPKSLVLQALLNPAIVEQLTDLEWDLLIRQGRRAHLLARLAQALGEIGRLDGVPGAPRMHLDSAMRMVERQGIAMRWEVECIRRALSGTGAHVTLLKGAAYLMAGLPAANGRVFADVDIIVPRSKLEAVESALLLAGWRGSHHSEYDQKYYRRWMHELPPLRHVGRATTIDVHHTILPETARIKVNTEALFDATLALPDQEDVHVLAPTDMLLHSATHLFHEGEFEKGLRDLFDLDSLFRTFGQDPGFWEGLVPRAVELNLVRPLHYAIRFTTGILGTPIPETVVRSSEIGRPGSVISVLMDSCYPWALQPVHASCSTGMAWLARTALYLRSHWIRMPFPLLTYHLGRKVLLRTQSAETSLADAPKVRSEKN